MRAVFIIFLVVAGSVPEAADAALAFDEQPATVADAPAVKSEAGRGDGKSSIASFLNLSSLGLAPLRWGGNLTDTFRWAKSDDGASSTNHFQGVVLRAASYIWQPWFARVGGTLNLSRGVAGSSEGDSDSTSQSVSGSGSLQVFPQSRFPFSLDYSVSDSRTESRITQETQNKRLGLRQEYRPLVGNARYFAKYDNSTMTSSTSADEDSVTSWQAGYSNAFANQTLGLDAQRTVSDEGGGGQGLLLDSYMLRHAWRVSESLNVDSNASMTESEFEGSASADSRSRYMQAYSTASWNPKQDVYVTGSLRYFNLSNETGESSNEVQSLGGNATINYNYTRNLSFNGSLGLTTTDTESGSNMVSTQSGNVSYNHDPLVFGNFSYNWGANGGVSNQISSEDESATNYNAGATHTLNHRYQLNERSSLTSYVSESMSVRFDQDGQSDQTLSHNAGVSYGVNLSEKLNGGASLSASDTRSFGEDRSDNQNVSLQVNGTMQISNYSTASANFNVQWNRSGTEDAESDGLATWNATGSASYMHSRAFGVPRLRYSLLFNINTAHTNARLLGDADADRTRNGYTLDQHLDYQIGRMDARLTATRAVQDGQENAMIYLQIGRAFGNY